MWVLFLTKEIVLHGFGELTEAHKACSVFELLRLHISVSDVDNISIYNIGPYGELMGPHEHIGKK